MNKVPLTSFTHHRSTGFIDDCVFDSSCRLLSQSGRKKGSIKVAPLLKKGPLTYDNTMATKLYEELQLSFVNNMEQPDFTDGQIFTEIALKWTLYFKQNSNYFLILQRYC